MFDKRNELTPLLLNNIAAGVYIVQHDASVIVNSQLAEYLKLENHDPDLRQDIFSLLSFDPRAGKYFENIHAGLLTGSEGQIAWCQYLERHDGSPLWLEINARRLQLDDRHIIVGTVVNVTPYRVLSETMSDSIQTLLLVLDALDDPIYAVTEDYRVVYGNKMVRDMARMEVIRHGWPEDAWRTWPCYRLRGYDHPCDDCRNSETFSKPGLVHWELFHEYFKIWYAITETRVQLPNIPEKTKLVAGRNITPWKKAEERVRKLSHGLLNAQETERNRLSRELHDDLSQQLCSMSLLLSSLASEISGTDSQNQKLFTLLSGAMESSITTVRGLASGLRPPAFREKGLQQALEDHFQKIASTHGLSVEFVATGLHDYQLEEFRAINLFRIIQEALHNVIKHAEAKKVKILLDASRAGIHLVIEDDGRGFDVKEFLEGNLDDKHLGLAGMAERVDLLNGEFEISSIPGKGSRIRVLTAG